MKLIVLTDPGFFVEEDKILTTLFDEGLDILHLRKPGSEPVYCERLLSLIPDTYHSRIVVHDHFYLVDEFGLMGYHLSQRNSERPLGQSAACTRTCYSLPELAQYKDECFSVPVVRDYGFGGVAVRGDLWRNFDVHQGDDFRQLVAHFRRLRKATE